MSREHLIHIPSIPPEGPDRIALIASMLVRLDGLESDVRTLQASDKGRDHQIADLKLALEQLRVELVALRTTGDAQLRGIKLQLEDGATVVGQIMRSQSDLQRDTSTQTKMIADGFTLLAKRLPSQRTLAISGAIGTAVMCGALALFQRLPASKPPTAQATEQKGIAP